MKKYIIIIVSCVSLSGTALAQNAHDALLFSRHYAGGTARSAGMSGAFGALGGDVSALSTNPAGLAVYRGTEFTFTPALNIASTNANYDGVRFRDNDTRFIFNSIGYVFTRNRHNETGLMSINFGFAYNRLSDFNSAGYVRKQSASSSLLDEFVLHANRNNGLNPFYEGLAWDVNAIWDDDGEFIHDYILEGRYGQPLFRSMSYRGGIGEYGFSMGLNFNHNLYFGATLGIQELSYRERFIHEESPGSGFEFLNNFRFSDEYTVNGWGLNFKAGVIYRPIQMLRLGAAVHTPTRLWLRPYHLTSMGTTFNKSPLDDGTRRFYYETESDPSERYQLTTPWRFNFSAATVIGSVGIVSVDVEYVDYKKNIITPRRDYDFENAEITVLLRPAVNVKTGAEFRLGPLFLRGGMAIYGNPYNKNQFDADIQKTLTSTISYSAGIGFRNRDFYIDVAYSFMKQPERIINLYEFDHNWFEYARIRTNNNKALVTFGFRF